MWVHYGIFLHGEANFKGYRYSASMQRGGLDGECGIVGDESALVVDVVKQLHGYCCV